MRGVSGLDPFNIANVTTISYAIGLTSAELTLRNLQIFGLQKLEVHPTAFSLSALLATFDTFDTLPLTALHGVLTRV